MELNGSMWTSCLLVRHSPIWFSTRGKPLTIHIKKGAGIVGMAIESLA